MSDEIAKIESEHLNLSPEKIITNRRRSSCALEESDIDLTIIEQENRFKYRTDKSVGKNESGNI